MSIDLWLTFVVSSLHQMTPLHVAAEKARIRIVEYVIDQKAEIDFQDQNGVRQYNTVYRVFITRQYIAKPH